MARRAISMALLLSGAAGLIYEVVWARALALIVGGEAVAVQSVLAAYFIGSAAGAHLLGRRLDATRTPARAYAWLEAAVAVSGLASLLMLRGLERWVPLISTGTSGVVTGLVGFGAALLTCFPATFFMGATLPALLRATACEFVETPRALSRLYALNTLGAVAGSLAAGTLCLPGLGARRSIALAALLNLLALGLVCCARQARVVTAAPEWGARRGRARWLWALGLSGFAGMAFELTAVRVLALTMESTVYSFSLTLGAYLLGILLASALCSRFAATEVPSDRAAVWCGAAALALGVCAQLLRLVNPVYLTLAAAGGDGFGARMLTELAVAALFVIPAAAPTTLVFCQLAPRLVRTPSAAASGVGDAFMATAIGSACAPLVVGLWAFEWDGARGGARLAVAALAVGALMLLQQAAQARLQSTLGLALGAFALTALLPQPLFSWPPVAGRRQLFAVEGIGGAVAVEERDGVRVLRTGNRYFEGGSASVFGERRQGQLPLLLHPSPKRALVLGLGTGTTLAAAAAYPHVHVDGVELMGEVLQAMPYFNNLHAGPQLGVYQADARAFVRARAQRAEAYDVVIADLYHPRQAGIGNLYTREHFEAIRALLAPGGHFMQWLSLHELQPADLASIVRTFLGVFPEASGWYAYFNARTGVLGLLGSNAPLGWHWDKLVARVQAAAAIAGVSETLLDRPRELMAAFVTDRAGLERIAGAGELNTDDRPLLEYAVPKSHTDDVERKLRSLDLVQRSVTLPDVSTLACGAPEPRCGARMRQLAGWQRAVDALMRGQRAELLSDEAGAVLAYQDGIRAAPDFSVNYLLLRQLALKWRRQGRAHDARALLSRLIELDPSNDDARKLLVRLQGS